MLGERFAWGFGPKLWAIDALVEFTVGGEALGVVERDEGPRGGAPGDGGGDVGGVGPRVGMLRNLSSNGFGGAAGRDVVEKRTTDRVNGI